MLPRPPPLRAAASRAATAASRAAISRAFALRAARPSPFVVFLRGLTLRDGLELFVLSSRSLALGCGTGFIAGHLIMAVHYSIYDYYEDRKLARKELEAELQRKD